jgi:hypothetical protein
VLIHGSGVVRAGQWARRLIVNNNLGEASLSDNIPSKAKCHTNICQFSVVDSDPVGPEPFGLVGSGLIFLPKPNQTLGT